MKSFTPEESKHLDDIQYRKLAGRKLEKAQAYNDDVDFLVGLINQLYVQDNSLIKDLEEVIQKHRIIKLL